MAGWYMYVTCHPEKLTDDWLEKQPWMKMYLLLKIGIFQLVMLVFRGVNVPCKIFV